MKGIILAGGSGTRLHPLTLSISKQLLPVYDKPMIFYPLTTLMQSGIREILIISTPKDLPRFRDLLGDGSSLGVEFIYKEQPEPKGIPQAFVIGEEFIGDDSVTLILGDNIFHSDDIIFKPRIHNANIWVTKVKHPNRYGVLNWDGREIFSIVEKPTTHVSNYAVTGVYQYPKGVVDVAKGLRPSSRGEVEITDINNHYIDEDRLEANVLGRNTVWLDAGTHTSLHQASSYVETIQERTGRMVGCPEETAWDYKWINDEQLLELASRYNNAYGLYLRQLLERV